MSKYSRKSLVRYIANNLDSPDLASHIAGFLIDNSKVDDLDSILRDVIDYRARESGIVELTAKTARAIDQSSRSQIESRVKQVYPNANQFVIHEEIDPSLIGGVDIQFANADLDLTVRNKLNRLKEAVN